MKNKIKNEIEIRSERRAARARGLLLLAGFLCMGFLSACSNVQREVISSKQASAQDRDRTFGREIGSPAGDRSVWNISYRQVN